MAGELNINQKLAIEHGKGPLLIIAGAGTGKTTVVTQRIKNLIVEKNVNPNQILALTFTEKAAYEMQERVDTLLPYGYTNLWINTFHSFCDRILRDEAHSIGLDPNYKLMTEAEAIFLVSKNIFDLGLKLYKPQGNPTKFIDALLVHFSRLKDEDVTPEEYLDWANKLVDEEEKTQYQELTIAYKKYEELKVKNSMMDFSDLISNTLLLFRKRGNLLKKYQNQFKYILVDEFQDTNFAQNKLAILLAGNDKNITVVADDDQSIYRFRGAAVSNVMQFKSTFKDAEVITLTDNYRSTQIILDSSYKLIQNNNPNRLEVVEKIDKKLKSHSTKKNFEIEFIHEKKSEDEADKIAKEIQKLGKKYKYNEIAILVRANNHAQPITAALARKKIPYQFLGPGYLFQQEEIKDLIAYLNFLANPMDSVALFRVLSMEIFNIPYIELIYLFNYAKKKNLSLYETLNESDKSFIKTPTDEKLNKFIEMSKRHIELSKKEQAGQILYYFLVDSGIFETLGNTKTIKDEKRVQNVAKFFDRIKNFENERPESNVFIVNEWLNLMIDLGDSPTAADVDTRESNAVNILTVHSSKGLEFNVVFLVNLVSDRFPSRERAEKIPLPEGIIKEFIPETDDFHLQEERRLFYVGMTRAKELLYFTAADFYGTGKRAKKLSQFIYEAIPDLKEKEKIENRITQLSLTEVLAPYQQNEEIIEEKPQNNAKVSYITFSNLQMFDICPLHYKAKVIFKIPTPATFVQSFGISLHNTLYRFYKELQEGQKEDLTSLLHILSEEWIPDGYLNKKHEEERFNEAKRIINDYYNNEYNPKIIPLALETPFSFNLKNGVKVFGKIDRVDKTKDGIEIIDYKTGADNPKAESAHILQLSIYALAAIKIKDELFNTDPSKIKLTLHFLEGNTKKTLTFSKSDLDQLEDDLIDKIKEIESSDFKCSGNIICKNCEFKLLCNTIS